MTVYQKVSPALYDMRGVVTYCQDHHGVETVVNQEYAKINSVKGPPTIHHRVTLKLKVKTLLITTTHRKVYSNQ